MVVRVCRMVVGRLQKSDPLTHQAWALGQEPGLEPERERERDWASELVARLA